MSSRERGAWIHSNANATFRFIKVVILTSTSSKPRGIHRCRANQPPTRRAAARRTARARQPNELARDARELRRVPHGGVPDAGVRGRQRRLPRRDRLRTPQAGHARHPLRHSDDVRPTARQRRTPDEPESCWLRCDSRACAPPWAGRASPSCSSSTSSGSSRAAASATAPSRSAAAGELMRARTF